MNRKNIEIEYVSCNFCGSNDYAIYLEQEDNRYPQTPRYKFRLVRCKECNLIYLNPRPTPEFIDNFYPDNYSVYGRIDENYDRESRFIDYFSLSYWRRILTKREKLSVVKKFCHNKKARLLEIGPGGGSFLKSIKNIGWEATGIEISSDMCDHISNSYNIECFNKDFNNLSDSDIKLFTDNKFDIIVFWSSFEHLYDPKGALDLCRNIIKRNGRLIIFVPNADSLEERFFRMIDKNPVDVPRHLFHFNRSTMKKLFNAAGFKPIRTTDFTFIESSRFKVNMNRLISENFRSKANISRIFRFVLYNLSILIGDMLSLVLSIFKRSHSITMVGEKMKMGNTSLTSNI